jgi:tetratricopeptide (TPR) repeat protein
MLAAGVLLLEAGTACTVFLANREFPTDLPPYHAPMDAEAFVERGRSRQQRGEFGGALDDSLNANQLREDGRTLAFIAYSMNLSRSDKSAIPYYEKALAAGFQTPELYNNLGYSYAQGSRPNWTRAREHLDRAIQLNPNLQAARHNRALLDLSQALRDEHYQPRDGMWDIKAALQLGAVPADMYRDAACIFAVAAERDPTLTRQAVDYVRLALENGFNPAEIAKDNCLLSLRGDGDFQKLVAQPAGPPPATKSVLVVDLIPDTAR